jgi:hypothetical protein
MAESRQETFTAGQLEMLGHAVTLIHYRSPNDPDFRGFNRALDKVWEIYYRLIDEVNG